MVPKTDEPVTPALDVEAEPPIKKACTKQPESVCVCLCVCVCVCVFVCVCTRALAAVPPYC
jgi:hypothetical protein